MDPDLRKLLEALCCLRKLGMRRDVTRNCILPYFFWTVFGERVYTPLSYFCKVGDLTMVRRLLDTGIDPCIKSNLLLKVAADSDQLHVVKYLAQKGALLEKSVCYALKSPRGTVWNYLMSLPGYEKRAYKDPNVLMSAVVLGNLWVLKEWTRRNGSDLDYENLFKFAVKFGRAKVVQYLLELVNQKPENAITFAWEEEKLENANDLITLACELGHLEVLKLILPFYDRSRPRVSPISTSIKHGHVHILQWLTNPENEWSKIPLHGKSKRFVKLCEGKWNMLAYLINIGAISHLDKAFFTKLVISDKYQIVKIALEREVNGCKITKYCNAMREAKRCKNQKMIALLESFMEPSKKRIKTNE